MKTAIWIEDGRQQVVLTPETDTERAVCEALEEQKTALSIYRGEFYACQGGWTRQRTMPDYGYSRSLEKPESLIIVLDGKEDAE